MLGKDEDEQEDSSTISATRYPCMPSLVALQQMRNRLHLAYVGKKLMKWTAQATGRELRKLGWELVETCSNFGEDMKDAFILLARARYFNPNLNKMVLEYIGHEANITVNTNTKSISGVKVLHLEVLDTGQDTYQHLGIEKGGQAILEAKQAWRDLLRRVILLLEQRTSFEQVDNAHRSATKKMNVLGKIVIPRTLLSIEYIMETLEERAREDFYRLKKILQNKRKNKNKCDHRNLVITCPVCLKRKANQEVQTCIICGALLNTNEELELLVPLEKTEDVQEEEESKLEDFKIQIGDIVEITREIEEKGLVSASVGEFMKTAKHLKEKLEQGSEVKEPELIPSDTFPEKLCAACKNRFEDEQTAKNINKEMFQESVITAKSERQLPDPNLCEIHAQIETDLELGTFETDIQEITKIIRVRNEDGSVSVEKKVIRIKKEMRAPINSSKLLPLPAPDNPNAHVHRIIYQSSEVSNKSTPFNGPKTVGEIAIKESRIKIPHKAKFEVTGNALTVVDSVVRSYISSMSFITLDSSNTNWSSLSSVCTIPVDNMRELAASSTNIAEIVRLLELHTQNYEMISTPKIEVYEDSSLTESERNLIARMNENAHIRPNLKSKSNDAVTEEIKNNLKITISFPSENKNNENEYQSNEN